MCKYQNIRAVIVGVGPELAALQAQAQKLAITAKVKFIIEKPAYNYYKLFDCFAQPSEFEGLSLALLEALCLQIPCIVTGNSKQHEIITHAKHGLIIEPNNPQELYEALELLYQDSKQNRKLAKQLAFEGASLVAEYYQLASTVSKYKKLFEMHYSYKQEACL